ncbi:MAG: hypothetical protein ABI852_02705 [Gemmatimonadaceae bacterium]
MKYQTSGALIRVITEMKRGVTALLLVAAARSALAAQSQIPLREVSAPELISSVFFGYVSGVRPLSNGMVLVNDGGRRQLVALDAALNLRVVVVDSFANGPGYGRMPAIFSAYRGDSLILINRTSMTIINPSGRLASWTPVQMQPLLQSISGNSNSIGTDKDGNFIYLANLSQPRSAPGDNLPPPAGQIVNTNFSNRRTKMLAKIAMEEGGSFSMLRLPDGRMVARTVLNPLPKIEEFVVLSDGTVAIVRQGNYHIEFVRTDGNVDSSTALPFAFRTMSEADRQGVIDSARNAQLQAEAKGVVTSERQGPAAYAQASAGATPTASVPLPVSAADLSYVSASALPERYPPHLPGGVSADANDNIWIRTTAADPRSAGATVYDVVNKKGELFQRVRVPSEKRIAGFGPDGVLYVSHETAQGWTVERVRIVR